MLVPPLVTPPPPPEVKIDNKLAVTQRSDDPSVPPPENARVVAEENRRVEQETIAAHRNLVEDDPEPTSAPLENTADSDDKGDSKEDLLAETQNVEGEDTRAPRPDDIEPRQTRDSVLGHGEEQAPAVAAASTAGQSSSEQKAQREVAAGSPKTGGEEPETVVIEDGMGRIRVRRTPEGMGAGTEGGPAQRGAGTDSLAERSGSRAAQGASRPNLSLSFSRFEETFGAEELRAQREAYLEQRRSKTRGGTHEREWKKFRAAIENFVPNVKTGNQTALNAAASPFAAYLADIHRPIHREFAMRFLRSLPLVSDGPYSDYSMYTRLEIVINQDGTLHHAGVVRTSGFLPFDHGVWNAVNRAAPFSEPPKKILSGDGRVYVHWDFHRNERQCGTFNAQPFILPKAGGAPVPLPSPLHDESGHEHEDEPKEGQHHEQGGSKYGVVRPRAGSPLAQQRAADAR